MARESETTTLNSIREAGAAFVVGTTLGWGRRELAEWLVCHYAPCVVPARRLGDAADIRQLATASTLEELRVEEVVREARSRTLRLLSELANERARAEALGRLMIATGAVAGVRDQRGGIAYAPTDQSRMRLVDRVMSLFMADYLNAPLDYRGVTVCRACGVISFANDEPHDETCPSARRDSRIFPIEPEPDDDSRLRA